MFFSNSGGMEVRFSKCDCGNFLYVTDHGVHLLLILLHFCMYIYIYVCMYVCIYIYIYMYINSTV